MASQGRSIEAVVTLDLRQFQTQITKIQGKLDKLSESLSFKTGAILDAKAVFTELETIMKGVTAQAKEINNAFANISAVKNLLENLNLIQRKVKNINLEMEKSNAIGNQSTAVAQKKASASAKELSQLSKIGKEHMKISREQNRQLTYYEKQQLELAQSNAELQRYWRTVEKINLEEQNRVRLQEEILAINKLDMDVRKATGSALSEIVDLTGLEADNILKVANGEKEILSFIEKQVSAEKERLDLIMAIAEMESAQISKVPVTGGKGANGGKNKLDKMGYLPSRIGSMALTMWGFNEIMDIYDKSSSNLNARGSQKYFSEALQTDQRYLNQTKQSTVQVRTEMSKLGDQLDALQKKYQKIDMTVVGANAEETAYKYGLQADKIGDLSEVMAIYGSEFVKQGRSQEDSILALNDALDGELRRLKEVNVGKEELEAHGWTGDQASMIDALKQIADERGYTLTAQNITNLNDAIETLELKISRDLVDAFEYIQPILMEVAKDFVIILEAIESLVGYLNEIWKKVSTRLDIMFGVQNMQKFGNISTKVIGGLITGLIGLYIIKKVASVFSSGWNTILDALGKTKPIDKASDSLGKLGGSTNTGGTSAPKERGGFKDGIKGLAENLGKMAKVFVEVAVAIAMAWALIEEAILLISAIGYTYESLKPQFNSGIEFIKEFGVWFALLGGALLGLSYLVGKVPDSAMEQVGKGAYKVALGMAIAMGLIAEAIVLLNAPLLAIASLGAVQEFAEEQINDGLAVIRMFANALHTIEQDDTIGWFIIGFVGLSAVLGFTADIVAVPLAIGIATTLGLVAEAIGLLVVPLGAIALLGGTASALGEENIKQGAETIRIVGECLKALEPSVRALLLIDLEVFGVNLVDWGNKFITGKTGLQSLVEDIIPNLVQFVRNFNEVDMSGAETVDATKVQAITQMAIDIPPLFTAMQNLNNAMGTSDAIGNIGGALGGGISGAIGMGLKGKLDQLYNDVKDVMDFATKLGGLGSTNGANASAIGQIANAIAQLKAKMDIMVTTINTASVNVRTASKSLGSAIKVGFNEGSSGFNTAVISVLAKGISEVQHRYDTWHSGGKASAQKLADGFKNHKPSLKTVTSNEIDYALGELDDAKDDFYNKGKDLGSELTRGYQDGADIHSPGLIARTTARELRYTMDALDVGKQMMYQGGVALGQALTNGYNSTENLKTDVGVLASKGVSSEQLQANAKNLQANTKGNSQVPQSFNPTFNIDMSNSTIIGIQDLDRRIQESIDKAIVRIHTPNGAIGY